MRNSKLNYGLFLFIMIIVCFLPSLLFADQIPIIAVLSKGDTLDVFGSKIEAAGDVNGDGFNDVWIYGKREIVNDRVINTYYLYYGGNPMDTVPDFVFRDSILYIKNVGDMNGDNYDDFIFHRYENDIKSFSLYYGGPLLDTIPDMIFPVHNPDEINFGNVFSICGGNDINGDNQPDLLLGEPGGTGSFSGKAYFYSSHPFLDEFYDLDFSGMGPYPEYYDYAFAVEYINNLDGGNYVGISGWGNGAYQMGGFVYLYEGSNRRINTFDSTPDIIINPPNGYIMPQFGSLFKSVGDVNNDGYSDIVISTLASFDAWLYFGGTVFDTIPDVQLGPSFEKLEPVGDINNDSYPDMMVSSSSFKGLVMFYYGGPDIDGFSDMYIDVPTGAYNFGKSMKGLGDVNGDGIDDFAIGCFLNDYGYWPGMAYIFAGWDGTPTDVQEDENSAILPNDIILHQNYPNPFNPSTTIEFDLPRKDIISLNIFNVLGQKITTLINTRQYSSGKHTILWNGCYKNGKPAPSGIYFYKLSGENVTSVKKMLLLK